MKLLFWILVFEGIAYLMGLVTQHNIYPWYASLNKSSLTPPSYVFSIVWTLLYLVLAIISWILSDKKIKVSTAFIAIYVFQILMNWAWTLIFFQLHWINLAAIWLVMLTGLNLILFIMSIRIDKLIAYLLLPYVLWLLFATYLNTVIALTN